MPVDVHAIWETWGERIFNARESEGMSRPQLGKAIGRDRATIERWERGEYPPSDELKVALCLALQHTWAELFPPPLIVLRTSKRRGSAA